MTKPYTHFSQTEFEERQERVRNRLRQLKLDGILLFKIEDMFWLCGYESDGFCIFGCMFIGVNGELVDESGSEEKAPLYPDGNWKPRRLVLIRDIKTASKDRGADKHHNALLEDVQLAIYARAWEIEHPGDLVIGVGVSDIGLETTHHIELDPAWISILDGLEIGERTNILTGLFRPISSTATSSSQPGFRAWLEHRLNAVFRADNSARNRRVAPNPSSICSYCSVSDICGLSAIGGEGRWG